MVILYTGTCTSRLVLYTCTCVVCNVHVHVYFWTKDTHVWAYHSVLCREIVSAYGKWTFGTLKHVFCREVLCLPLDWTLYCLQNLQIGLAHVHTVCHWYYVINIGVNLCWWWGCGLRYLSIYYWSTTNTNLWYCKLTNDSFAHLTTCLFYLEKR